MSALKRVISNIDSRSFKKYLFSPQFPYSSALSDVICLDAPTILLKSFKSYDNDF